MNDRPLSAFEWEYYYRGFYRVLKRYRYATVLGWLVVLFGCVSIPLGWRFAGAHGLVDIALSLATVVAGLLVVHQAVASLSAYVAVPMHGLTAGSLEETPQSVKDIIELMKEVDSGGWQEAYASVTKLEEMQTTHGLPSLS